MSAGRELLFRHSGVALLRAAVLSLDDGPDVWPDPADAGACRAWLELVRSRADMADAIRQASPALADRLDAIHRGDEVQDRQVGRAALAAVRYVLRATGRSTPFGLFAGVAPAFVGGRTRVRWGDAPRSVASANTQRLADVVDRLEACPDLLERLDVVFTNLAVQRGRRLEAPHGPNRVTVRCTSAVEAARNMARTPIRFGELADGIAETFVAASPPTVRTMLAELVRQGFLITCLRAPLTVTDPLGHLVDRLQAIEAGGVPPVVPLLDELSALRADLHCHNGPDLGADERSSIRAGTASRMRAISRAGRTLLGVDLRLDCEVHVPQHVAREMERAASALMRLTRQPTGEAQWRDYYTAFCERYGTGTLVPVPEVVDPDAGLGLPAGYPGSVFPSRASGPSARDEKLLALAWDAVAGGGQELVLDDESISALAVDGAAAELRVPPHVELVARISATSTEALDRGDYLLSVAPGRSAGTFTSRFTTLIGGSALGGIYAAVPTTVGSALPVQMSFPPAYPHAETICRVPAYLDHVLSLGEHRDGDDATVALDDLAVTATRDGLHLVSISRRRVVEPQVFSGLALDKQPPPLARFLLHLSRGLSASWHRFDWGPSASRLPYLPRVRYRRAILAPARWKLTADDLPAGTDQWRRALERWTSRWNCPATVELTDADCTLRLALAEPAHAAILHAHLARHGHATLTETAADATEYGWINGHAHEIVVPLVSTRPAAPPPAAGPLLTNDTHGQLPGSPDAAWLNAKLHTHPDRLDEVIAEQLPRLLDALDGDPAWWFVRYRSFQESDHLRLRIRTPSRDTRAARMAAVGAWAQQLRNERVAGRLVFDTYYPETGRYGHGPALEAAEELFVADSRSVAAQLRHPPEQALTRDALTAVNMTGIVSGFLGGTEPAMRWLTSRPSPPSPRRTGKPWTRSSPSPATA